MFTFDKRKVYIFLIIVDLLLRVYDNSIYMKARVVDHMLIKIFVPFIYKEKVKSISY